MGKFRKVNWKQLSSFECVHRHPLSTFKKFRETIVGLRPVQRPTPTATVPRGMRTDEPDRLHEHARGATARFIDAAEYVLRARRLKANLDVADEVNELAEALFVERRTGIILGQHALQGKFFALDRGHGLVYELPDGGLLSLSLQVRPARFSRHPEDVLRAVFVWVFRSCTLGAFRLEPGGLLLEGKGDVFEKDEPEHGLLVLGSVHAAAQLIGHLPELGFVADGDGACFGCVSFILLLCHVRPHVVIAIHRFEASNVMGQLPLRSAVE